MHEVHGAEGMYEAHGLGGGGVGTHQARRAVGLALTRLALGHGLCVVERGAQTPAKRGMGLPSPLPRLWLRTQLFTGKLCHVLHEVSPSTP